MRTSLRQDLADQAGKARILLSDPARVCVPRRGVAYSVRRPLLIFPCRAIIATTGISHTIRGKANHDRKIAIVSIERSSRVAGAIAGVANRAEGTPEGGMSGRQGAIWASRKFAEN